MAKKRFDTNIVNPSEKAQRALDSALGAEDTTDTKEDVVVVDPTLREKEEARLKEEAEEAKEGVEEISSEVKSDPSEESKRILARDNRDMIRVLMVSTDRNIFTKGSAVQRRMRSYADLFDELHIVVFSLQSHGFRPLRIAPNAWVYPTNSKSRYRYVFDAYRLARKQLAFTDGFRADLVSTQDPFEAGLAGYIIARRTKRALQLQLHTDPFEPVFKKMDSLNPWRLLIARFLFPRADGIRVVSEHLKEEVSKRYKKMKEKIDVLPVFSDITMWRDTEASFDLHEKYPDMKFIILVVARFTHEKGVSVAIEATTPVLRQYPTVGLVIVGDGPDREKLEEQVATLGIGNQVSFESWQEDLVSYYKSADLFLNTSSYEGYGRTLIEAAASGLPVLTSDVGMARELFTDGESGYICPVGDTACFAQKIEHFLSNNHLRSVFSKEAKERVFAVVLSNVDAYHEAYRDSMEACVVRHAEKGKKKGVEEAVQKNAS